MIYFISLGSNEEPRTWFLRKAIEFISEISQIEKVSSLYESEPWGFSGYPFLNMCLKINTELPPKSLLNFFKRIEMILGRKISKDPFFQGYSDRPIDIDILFWEKGIYDDEEITIPHPLAHKRKFILIPLAEIEENLIHPIFLKSISDLIEEIDDDTWVIKLKNL